MSMSSLPAVEFFLEPSFQVELSDTHVYDMVLVGKQLFNKFFHEQTIHVWRKAANIN